jgi:hypothetical protein
MVLQLGEMLTPFHKNLTTLRITHTGFGTGLIKMYRTIIFPVVLYGCESRSLTLREECRLRGFENRVLRRIFGPKRDEVTGKWRRLHNKELYALYSSPYIILVIKSRQIDRTCSMN